jgi:iron complex outermembrane recepter protein
MSPVTNPDEVFDFSLSKTDRPKMNHHNPRPKNPSRPGFARSCFFLVLPALGGLAYAQSTAPAVPATEGETVQLSTFTVSTERDSGYRASNSIAGTRTDTPIKDIPLNIQVFTKDLADDLLVKSQVDFEAYNASLVYGAADRASDNAIQQPYQNFLVRGFRQNWGLRDGIREYDPVDTQNLARVELVKGPAAALYGLAYPGGVMNNITKTVDFSHNFTQIRLTGGGEGDYRANIDANYSGSFVNGGKFGVRYNGTHERSEDYRAHSDGEVKLQAVELAWQPTKTTSVEFMAEQGFRSKPNGLGWFSAGGDPAGAGNHADIPLQVAHPEIPWDWNWANGKNHDSLDTKLYRGTVTQKIGEQLQVQAYVQYSKRLEISGNGWDASGSGGADSWESASSGYDAASNRIISTYHYRDWGNQMHAYGATAVYKVDFQGLKNTFAFGSNVWGEKELSRQSSPLNPLASAQYYAVQANIPIVVPNAPPPDLVPVIDRDSGYHHENNSNDYYFASWQASALGDKLKTNIGVNKTNLKTIAWDTGTSTTNNTYTASKVSPLYGALYAVTKEISIFALHATSLFPDSTKDSFGHQFSPQVGSSIEGGFKFELFNGKLSGTTSYYNIKQTGGTQSDPNKPNAQTAVYDGLTPAQRAIQFPSGRPLGDIIQGGEQKSKGYELDLVYQPTAQWQLVASYAHTDHQFTQSSVPTTIGETFPYAIKDRYSLLSKYSFTDGSVKGLSLGFGFSGGSKSLQDYQNFGGRDVARYEPGRNVLDLFGNYKFKVFAKNAAVQVNIRNALKTSDYAGWKPTGSPSILATERYEVPTSIVYRLTFIIDL